MVEEDMNIENETNNLTLQSRNVKHFLCVSHQVEQLSNTDYL